MPDFVVDLGGIGDGLGYFIAEKTTVTLPKAMHQTFHGRLRHSQCARERGVRNTFALGSQATAQGLKSAQASLAFAFFPETAQRLLNYGRGPAQIEEALGRPFFQGMGRDGELRWRLRHPIVPRDKLRPAAAFARMLFLESVVQKILKRLEEERSEPAAAGIGVPEPVTFQHHNEKILGEILCVFHGMTAPADE